MIHNTDKNTRIRRNARLEFEPVAANKSLESSTNLLKTHYIYQLLYYSNIKYIYIRIGARVCVCVCVCV